MSNEESSSHKSGHFKAEDQDTIDNVHRNPKVSILNNDANFQTTFQNFNTNLRKSSEALRQSSEALNKFTNDSIDKKENCEPNTNKVICSQLRESFHQEMQASKLEQQAQSKTIPKKKRVEHIEKGSVAQTPCFAETPNTTNQFKGYKIDEKNDTNKIQVKIVMS